MSTGDSESTSFISAALITVPPVSALPENLPQLGSESTDELGIALDGFQEWSALVIEDFLMKEKGPMEYPTFTPGPPFESPKGELDFAIIADIKPTFENETLSAEGVMAILFGEEQSLVNFPSLQLTDDVYISSKSCTRRNWAKVLSIV